MLLKLAGSRLNASQDKILSVTSQTLYIKRQPARLKTLLHCMTRHLPSRTKQHQDACNLALLTFKRKHRPAPRYLALHYSSPPSSPAHQDRRPAAGGMCPSPASESANAGETCAVDESEETEDPHSASPAVVIAAAATTIAAAAATAGDTSLAPVAELPELKQVKSGSVQAELVSL